MPLYSQHLAHAAVEARAQALTQSVVLHIMVVAGVFLTVVYRARNAQRTIAPMMKRHATVSGLEPQVAPTIPR